MMVNDGGHSGSLSSASFLMSSTRTVTTTRFSLHFLIHSTGTLCIPINIKVYAQAHLATIAPLHSFKEILHPVLSYCNRIMIQTQLKVLQNQLALSHIEYWRCTRTDGTHCAEHCSSGFDFTAPVSNDIINA